MTSSAELSAARRPNGTGRNGGEGRVDRVAFVAGELRDDSIGHSVLRLARELLRRGRNVDLLCGGGPLVGELRRIGLDPLVSRQLQSAWGPLWVPRALRERLQAFRPQLVHLFGRRRAAWGPKLSQAAGAPYLLTVMTFAPSARRGRLAGDWSRGSVMAVSEELREALVNQARIPKHAIAVVPIGIALEDYERYRDDNGREHTPVVGMVGPLAPDRGCDTFLRAARQVLDAGHDALFLIAGQGPERERLRRLVRKLNIDKWVTLVSDFTDYRRMIAVLDICVLPALHEGLSLNAIEAMACRKPVVATGVGAVYDIVEDGETGLLAPKRDPVAIAEKIIRLIEDRDLARRIVDAAYRRVEERFSLPVSVGRLLQFYSQCLARTEMG